jgi:hypothetical protein
MWRDLESWLMTMRVLGSVRIIKAGLGATRKTECDEAAAWLKLAHGWYQRSEHKSHKIIYSGPGIINADSALLVKPSLVRRLAAELPKIGLERSADVAKRFKSVEEMVNASEKDWMGIDGIGKGIASTVYRAIHGGGNGNGGKRS